MKIDWKWKKIVVILLLLNALEIQLTPQNQKCLDLFIWEPENITQHVDQHLLASMSWCVVYGQHSYSLISSSVLSTLWHFIKIPDFSANRFLPRFLSLSPVLVDMKQGGWVGSVPEQNLQSSNTHQWIRQHFGWCQLWPCLVWCSIMVLECY